MMREKERARLRVEPFHLKAETTPETKGEWFLSATIKVQNIGGAKAFDIKGRASLWVQDSSAPISPPKFLLPWHDDPSFRISAEPGSYTVQADSQIMPLTLNQFVNGMTHCEKGKFLPKKVMYLQGFIEYETLGIKFRRNFGWRWLPGGWEDQEGRVHVGDRFIAGQWYEDDNQKNSETQNPN
jgi:hypothetical protein